MKTPIEIVGRHRDIVLVAERVRQFKHGVSALYLVNLGTAPVFVDDGLIDMGGGKPMFTERSPEPVLPGQVIQLFPTQMLEGKADDSNDYDSLVRSLRNAGASPLTVRVVFGDGEATIRASVGSLEGLIVYADRPTFDLHSVEFEDEPKSV